jgi:alkylation response protein AidB-like acyl-CoA dehydrogenase
MTATIMGNASTGFGAIGREEMLARARSLTVNLRARAEQSQQERRAPDATIAEMKESGLLRLMQPARHGGHEMGWDVFCEVTTILTRACGSQGWVYRVLADHPQMIGTFTAEAQDDVWGGAPDTLASSSFAPTGVARAAPGGYRFSGRHTFSSGIDHASWVICGGLIKDDAGKTVKMAFFLIPKREGTVIDDWFVTGLEGTGSKSFAVENAYVPAHRVLDAADSTNGTTPGSRLNAAPIFRLPRLGYTTSGFSAALVGMAQSLLEEWLAHTATRRSWGQPVAQLESSQLIAAEAACEIEAAERLYLDSVRDAMRRLEAGESLTASRTSVVTGHVGYACQLVLAAGNRLNAATGGKAVYRGNPLERQYRNLLAGAQHVAIGWPLCGSRYGAHLLREHGAELGPERRLF